MGLLVSAFQRRLPDDDVPSGWHGVLGSWAGTAAGVSVTEENALTYTTVYACVRVLSEFVAKLPLKTYQRIGNGNKEEANSFYLYGLLHDRPNPLMSSFAFRRLMQAHVLLWGNAYAEIEWTAAGKVKALWPLRPDRMESVAVATTVVGDGDQLVYSYRLPNNKLAQLPGRIILHLRGLGLQGYMGLSPIAMARQSIGLGLAAEKFGAKFFANGATPGGVISHPGNIGPEGVQNLRASWSEHHQGLDNVARVAILEEGASYQQIGVPPDDAQFLETRKFQRSEIAGLFGVPPHKIGDLERATFSNIEHQAIEFMTDSIDPWLVNWEQELNGQLLSPAEQRRYFVEHVREAAVQADIITRYQAYGIARQNGWMSANDIRRRENQNPLPDGQGDVYLVPLNMVPASEAGVPASEAGVPDDGPQTTPDPQTTEEGSQRKDARAQGRYAVVEPGTEERAQKVAKSYKRLMASQRAVMADTFGRVMRRESQDIMAAARKAFGERGRTEFILWLERFYEDHEEWVTAAVSPMYLSYADSMATAAARDVDGDTDGFDGLAFTTAYVAAYVARHIGRSRQDLAPAANAEDPIAALEEITRGWKEDRPEQVALDESVRAGNAVVREIYKANGVTTLRWVSSGESTCPYCSELNGKVVGIEEPFAYAGQALNGEGEDKPLRPSRKFRHPPAHAGCDCVIVPG